MNSNLCLRITTGDITEIIGALPVGKYAGYYSSGATGTPSSYGTFEAVIMNNTTATITAVDTSSGAHYINVKTSNTWKGWERDATNTDFRRGTAMLTRKPNTITSVTVNFSNPFPSTPLIFLCGNTNGPDEGILSVSNVSTTSFIINVKSQTSTSNIAVYWLAISQ